MAVYNIRLEIDTGQSMQNGIGKKTEPSGGCPDNLCRRDRKEYPIKQFRLVRKKGIQPSVYAGKGF